MLVKLRCKSNARDKNKSQRKTELDSHIEHYRVKSVFRANSKSAVRKKIVSARETKTMMGSYNISISPTERKSKKEEKVESKIEKRVKTERNFKFMYKKLTHETVINEILNTKSDILEIKRDLATYDFAFIKNTNFFELLEEFNGYYKDINNAVNVNIGYMKNGEDLSNEIRSTFKNRKEHRIFGLNDIIITERFNVEKDMEQFKKIQFYSGVCLVSSLKCVLSTKTTLFCNHFINCLTPSGKSLTLQVEKNISDILNAQPSTYSQKIKEKIIPFLFINQKFQLEFDEDYSKNFINFYIQLKGLRQPILLFVTDSDKNFIFQIKDLNLCLILEKLSLETQNFQIRNIPKLKLEILNHLFIHKKKLIWGNHPFEVRERSSKYLNINFLTEAFDESLKKIFSIKILYKRRGYKIEGIQTNKGKFLKIFNNTAFVIIRELSQEFIFLFGMQCLDFFKDFVTISKSLEMGVIIKSLFNV